MPISLIPLKKSAGIVVRWFWLLAAGKKKSGDDDNGYFSIITPLYIYLFPFLFYTIIFSLNFLKLLSKSLSNFSQICKC
jgi:uncharacterized membrane protein YfhO